MQESLEICVKKERSTSANITNSLHGQLKPLEREMEINDANWD